MPKDEEYGVGSVLPPDYKIPKEAKQFLQKRSDRPKAPDTAGHTAFKYDSTNIQHRQILNTLLNNKVTDKVIVNPDGQLAYPQAVADMVGAPSDAVKLAPRPSEKDSAKRSKKK